MVHLTLDKLCSFANANCVSVSLNSINVAKHSNRITSASLHVLLSSISELKTCCGTMYKLSCSFVCIGNFRSRMIILLVQKHNLFLANELANS